MNTTTTFSLEPFCKATSDEWNYKRNHPLTPADVDINVESSKKVWWICHVCKNEWSTTVSDRINNYGYGCRECYKNQLTELEDMTTPFGIISNGLDADDKEIDNMGNVWVNAE